MNKFFKYISVILSLHSNLVIFKFTPLQAQFFLKNLYIPIWLYSNENYTFITASVVILYIPIWLYSNCNKCNEKFNLLIFTFQSGSIQMIGAYMQYLKFKNLYIPIWFYSNHAPLAIPIRLLSLYIPIWFYSNDR